ncbi:MAG: hypothetical protein GF408_00465 [Candidatus Omnitrophica bacterium]|nr:hypothetical protein [Candidatus Omnitrophota bacterium]
MLKAVSNILPAAVFAAVIMSFCSASAEDGPIKMGDGDLGLGIPWMQDASQEADLDLCPMGSKNVIDFLAAWQKGDYEKMYALIDERSKQGYPYEQAKFDFQFMEFKEYTISSVRKNEGDFDYYLSYGDWRSGNKSEVKMSVSGKTNKILLFPGDKVFKKSAADYF